ncbi:MAG: ATP-binding protein [Bacteroidia bacterium]|nr:ATP-binding protein [Bacteroidia bacterium]
MSRLPDLAALPSRDTTAAEDAYLRDDAMMGYAHHRRDGAKHATDRTASSEAPDALRENGGVHRLRLRIQDAFGEYRLVTCDAWPLPGMREFCLIARESPTALEEDSKALRLRRLLELTTAEVIILQRDGTIHSVTAAAANAVGCSACDLEGTSIQALSPDFVCGEGSELLHSVDTVGAYRERMLFRHRDGGSIRRDMVVTSLEPDYTEFLCVTVLPESESIPNEPSTHSSVDRFRELAEHAEDLIYSYRLYPERGFEYVNQAATAITGYTPGEHYADPDLGLKLIHPDDAAKLAMLMQDRDSDEPMQLRWMKKDGTMIWTEQINRIVRDESGRPVRIDGIARDMTRHKETEEEIRKTNATLEMLVDARTRELHNSNRDLETVLYSVAHDLRAPLRHIEGYLGLLRSELTDTADGHIAAGYLDTLERTAARMSGQFDALLSFSRIGHQEMRHTTIPMEALVDEVKHQLDSALAPQNVEWRIGDLPPACGDPDMVLSVVSNLLGNAVKFTRQCAHARISIEGVMENGMNRYRISDNGEGFDMRHAHKLFQLFQRLHTREEYEGHGIGLALVRRIVHLHGGSISADGRPGHGATFTFTLPSAAACGCAPHAS